MTLASAVIGCVWETEDVPYGAAMSSFLFLMGSAMLGKKKPWTRGRVGGWGRSKKVGEVGWWRVRLRRYCVDQGLHQWWRTKHAPGRLRFCGRKQSASSGLPQPPSIPKLYLSNGFKAGGNRLLAVPGFAHTQSYRLRCQHQV